MRFSEWGDRIKEQEWYQQLQAIFQQLSPEQQLYVKWGGMITTLVLLLYFGFSTLFMAKDAKEQYFEKLELSQMLTNATEEIRRIKGQSAGMGQIQNQSWQAILSNLAGVQGIAQNLVQVTKESPGAVQGAVQETLLEVQVKEVPLRPLVQFLYQIDHGNPPMRLKGISIDHGEGGLLSARLNVSGYMSKSDKGEKR